MITTVVGMCALRHYINYLLLFACMRGLHCWDTAPTARAQDTAPRPEAQLKCKTVRDFRLHCEHMWQSLQQPKKKKTVQPCFPLKLSTTQLSLSVVCNAWGHAFIEARLTLAMHSVTMQQKALFFFHDCTISTKNAVMHDCFLRLHESVHDDNGGEHVRPAALN